MNSIRNWMVLVVLIGLVQAGFTQTERIILLENFIQASCQPCPYYNQEMQNFLDTTVLSIVTLNYHAPFPDEDIMYTHSQEDVDDRMDFYEITEIPYSIIDGNYFQGGPLGSYFNGENGWSVDDMHERALEESPLEISVNHEFSEDIREVDIAVDLQVLESLQGSFSFYLVVLEKRIVFDEPPGFNGELRFRNVVKDVIRDDPSFTLPENVQAGFQNTYSYTWPIENVYENEMIAVAAFIQDNETQEVLQAGLSEARAINETDIAIESVLEPTENYCNDPVYHSVSPVIKVRNRGNEPIDSLIVYCQVNDEPQDTSYFAVDLGFFAAEELYLSELNYSGSAPDTLFLKLELPDEMVEDDTLNNFAQVVFDTIADIVNPNLFLYLQPDNYGSEITWEFTDETGAVLYSGGPYEDFNTDLIIDTLTIIQKGCYTFSIYDSYGDGLQSGNIEGHYSVENEEDEMIFSGGEFRTLNTHSLKAFKIPPTPVFSVNNGDINVSTEDRILIRFYEIIRFVDNSLISDPDSLAYLKKSSLNGEEVNVNFKISNNKKTFYFDDDLEYWTNYYLGFNDGMEDTYDNPIPAQHITFRTQAEVLDVNDVQPKAISLSPNPASDLLLIKNTSNKRIQKINLINQTGQVLQSLKSINKSSNGIKLELNHLDPGLYFITILLENKTETHKFIKVD